MTKRMLIDATHAEETRVVVLDGNRLEDFDVETASRRQLKGNIYLAKVVRVEPSLQAAFVEYGGNRHGFLAFGEIHPDYYQIPIADRQRLLQMQEEEARAAEQEDDEDDEDATSSPAHDAPRQAESLSNAPDLLYAEQAADEAPSTEISASTEAWDPKGDGAAALEDSSTIKAPEPQDLVGEAGFDNASEMAVEANAPSQTVNQDGELSGSRVQQVADQRQSAPETIGGEHDPADEPREARSTSRYLRNYKIQEVIRRRQILLVQVVKEERGTKGAALTTYISLAGRFCVLMPNSPRGGGISRKITSAADRRRLKEVTSELEIPRGMGLIVRTAGAARPKPEIKRDCEYLLRLWDEIRDHTMQSVAPAQIYEEASLIKRAIRDVYSRDVDEILIDGEEGWKAARDFMRMLMPTHVKKVQLWRDGGAPLFARQQVEAQLDAMLVPTVQLRSGGYLVIDQTEALVAIDVNSGRSTRERGIEETALRTNLEAADEVARQLRLRDLAGLIVIDFIDMESKKHNAAVERRIKEALKDDRARIQLGSISHFGLLEMSRQRLRPSVAETSQTACPHCGGTGHVRSTDSAALHVLRAIEDEGSKRRAAEIMVHVAGGVAMFILNNKRARLTEIEARTGLRVCFNADDDLLPGQTRIERLRALSPQDLPPPISQTQARMDSFDAQSSVNADVVAEEEDSEEEDEAEQTAHAPAKPGETTGPDDNSEEGLRRRRKRRRRRSGRREDGAASGEPPMPPDAEQPELEDIEFPGAVRAPLQAADHAPLAPVANEAASDTAPQPKDGESPGASTDGAARKGTRSRRGRGRGPRPRENERDDPSVIPPGMPTPANPFGSVADIFDILEQSTEQGLAGSSPQTLLPDAAPTTEALRRATYAIVAVADERGPESPNLALSDATTPAEPGPIAARSEPIVGPAIQPVIIGAGETEIARKRGWWRR
jgi:ribonuclease E